MAKRINTIKEVEKIIKAFSKNSQDLMNIAKKTKSKELSKLLATFVYTYATINYQFSLLLMSKVPGYYKKDKIDSEFEKLMGKNFKKKKRDK